MECDVCGASPVVPVTKDAGRAVEARPINGVIGDERKRNQMMNDVIALSGRKDWTLNGRQSCSPKHHETIIS